MDNSVSVAKNHVGWAWPPYGYGCCVGMTICLLLSVVCGCSRGPSYESATVTGTVTIDGNPVPKGQITFCPATQGPVTGGEIRHGEYRCENVPLGKHHVTFLANAAEPTIITDITTGAKHEVPKSILPQHSLSGLDVEVKADAKTLDFPLQSRP